MNKKHKVIILLTVVTLAFLIYQFFAHASSMAVLNPQGIIAEKQRNLIILTSLLSLLIIIPVFFMTFYFAWKYRENGDKNAKYEPDWDHSVLAESIWWAVPTILILILAGITWKTTHELDPFKSINSSSKEMTIQVVALDWKWLFIYPNEQIASVNYVQFPQKTPIKFEITSDAPMNSFWIPNLGGQIYAMNGMSTHLNLMAENTGVYRGSSANLSGRGFAGMHFKAVSTTQEKFDAWVNSAQNAPEILTLEEYQKLARPSESNPIKTYSNIDVSLYDTIVMKYMKPITDNDRIEGLETQ